MLVDGIRLQQADSTLGTVGSRDNPVRVEIDQAMSTAWDTCVSTFLQALNQLGLSSPHDAEGRTCEAAVLQLTRDSIQSE